MGMRVIIIRAKTDQGELINVEMQLFNQYDLEKRTLLYWGKQYSRQLLEDRDIAKSKNVLRSTLLISKCSLMTSTTTYFI